jgi:hypothetical protein
MFFLQLNFIVNVLFTLGSTPHATLVIIIIIITTTNQYWSKLSFIPLKGCISYPILGNVHNPLAYDMQRCSSWNLVIYINVAGWACKCWCNPKKKGTQIISCSQIFTYVTIFAIYLLLNMQCHNTLVLESYSMWSSRPWEFSNHTCL